MKKFLMSCAVALLLCLLYLPTYAAQASLAGEWVGGVEINGKWIWTQAHIKAAEGKLEATFDLSDIWFLNMRGLKPADWKWSSPLLHFQLATDAGAFAFDGELKDNALSGQVKASNAQGTFRLIRVAAVNPRTLEAYSGSYQFTDGHFAYIGRGLGGAYIFTDYRSGEIRALYPSSEESFFTGESVLVPFPEEMRINFLRSKEGEVTGIEVRRRGQRRRTLARKVKLYREEEVRFKNGDVTLGGTLKIPLTKGPHPAIVIAGGAGSWTRRSGEGVAHLFVNHGIAALTYDKRGSGQSTGELAQASFEVLADDMLAGVRLLKNRSDINPKQIGVRGASEGGWVSPLAAARSNGDVAFVISISAGALAVEGQENRRVEIQMRGDGFSESEIREALEFMRLKSDFARTGKGWDEYENALKRTQGEEWLPYLAAIPTKDDPDWQFGRKILAFEPIKVLEKVRCPIIIVLGSLDWNYLNELKEESITGKALRRGGNKDYLVRVFPGANHALWAAQTGGTKEFPFLKRYAARYFTAQLDWLLKRVNVSRRS